MITIGMDVHVRNSYVHAAGSDRVRLLQGRAANRLSELGQLLAPVERTARSTGEPVYAVLESTTNARAMQRMLIAYGQEASIDLRADVVDARKIRVIAESVSKCDRLDAAVLCELAQSNLKLPTCYLPDDEEFALREHLRARSDLVRMRTMLKNRVQALLHRRGILAPQTDLFVGSGRAYLDQLSLDEAGRVILNRFVEGIDRLNRLLAESVANLRQLARSPRWAAPSAILRSMPGVGLITSLTILAELGDIKRFRSRAAVANFSGMVPRRRDSNEKRYSGGITRRGPCHLRGVLCEAAWVAVRRVPRYHDLFARIEKKRNKPTAILAVGRTMLEDAYTMLKKNEPFRFVAPAGSDAPIQEGAIRRPAQSRKSRKAPLSVAG